MSKETISIVALIPARGGSKRVPGKNIRRLGDHPLIAYTIAAAIESRIFDAVIVSTDKAETANIARHYGAEIPFMRPPAISTDTSPDIEWVEYTLTRLRDEGRLFSHFSILRPTSPFRQPDTIQRAWAAFAGECGVDSLRAVEKCAQHPGKMWVIRRGRMLPLLPLTPPEQPWHSSQYQSLPEDYVQNGSLEIAGCDVVFDGRTLAGNTIVPFVTSDAEGSDINKPTDWLMAEKMLADGSATLPAVPQAPYGRSW